MAKKRKPRVLQRFASPDENWAGEDVREALAQCERIRGKIIKAPESVMNKVCHYFADINLRIVGVRRTIAQRQQVTANQKNALDSWEGAVDKWLEHGGD